MPHSHHSHSGQFCKHASGTLEDVVKEAIRQGFEIYGLTEHVPRYRVQDLYPEEQGISLDVLAAQFDHFLDEAHRLKVLYGGNITLLVGLETELITETDVTNLEQCLRKHGKRIEYLVGSVHHVNAIPIDFDTATYRKSLNSFLPNTLDTEHRRMESFLCSYFDAQFQLMTRFHPEVIGHFDLCRLYDPSLMFQGYPEAWAKAERNVKYAVGYGALFELNAAALRKSWDSAYPGEDAATLIMQNGGRFALSDDSHGPHAVGLNYDRMANYARRLGIKEVWTLTPSDEPNAGGRFLRPRKLERWDEHDFWRRRGTFGV